MKYCALITHCTRRPANSLYSTNEHITVFAFICLMVFRPKFTYNGNLSDEFSVLDGNPSSNINNNARDAKIIVLFTKKYKCFDIHKETVCKINA